MGANAVRFFDDRLGIFDKRASKDDVRDRNNESLLVDRFKNALGGHMDAIVGLDHVDPCSVGFLGLPEIHDGGKVHVAIYDLVARATEVEATGNDRLTNGYVLVHADGAFWSIHDRPDLIAYFAGEHPPFLFPGPNATGRPCVTKGLRGVIDASGHGAQRVADHVGCALKNRELRSVAKKIILHRHYSPPSRARRQRSAKQDCSLFKEAGAF